MQSPFFNTPLGEWSPSGPVLTVQWDICVLVVVIVLWKYWWGFWWMGCELVWYHHLVPICVYNDGKCQCALLEHVLLLIPQGRSSQCCRPGVPLEVSVVTQLLWGMGTSTGPAVRLRWVPYTWLLWWTVLPWAVTLSSMTQALLPSWKCSWR